MAQSFLPVSSGTLRVNAHPVKTGETIAVGDPVRVDTDGLLVCAAAGSASLCGVAAEACTSAAAGTIIGVYDDPKQVYKCKADNASQVLQAEVGDTCDIAGSTGAFYANLDATSTNVIRVRRIGTFEDPLLTGTFPFNSGPELFVEIALHQFNS